MPTTIMDATYREVTDSPGIEEIIQRGLDAQAQGRQASLDLAQACVDLKATCTTVSGGSTYGALAMQHWGLSEGQVCKLLKIGECSQLFRTAKELPPSVETLYVLTTLPDEVLEDAIEDGTVNRGMTRADVQELKPKKEKREPTDKQKWAAALGVVRRAAESVPEPVLKLMIKDLGEMLEGLSND